MKVHKFILLASLLSGTIWAQSGFLDYQMDGYNSERSKWQLELGAHYIQYPTTLPEFKGEYYKAKKYDDQDLYGPQVSIGREFNLWKGISVTAKTGAFYYRTFDKETGQASKDINLDLAENRRDHLAYGANASLSLNYIIETEKIDIQPFVMGAVGVGRAQIERRYHYDGLGDDAAETEKNREKYQVKIEDTFSYREAGLGINFISRRGLITYIKASRTVLALNSRDIEGKIKEKNGTEKKFSEKEDKNQEHLVNSAAIGLGFLF